LSYFWVDIREEVENDTDGTIADWLIIVEKLNDKDEEWHETYDIDPNNPKIARRELRSELRRLEKQGHTVDWESDREVFRSIYGFGQKYNKHK
jgi:hypothetical protein